MSDKEWEINGTREMGGNETMKLKETKDDRKDDECKEKKKNAKKQRKRKSEISCKGWIVERKKGEREKQRKQD